MSKLVCGVGINDADYATHIYDSVGGKQRQLWRCPFYKKWKSMIERSCSVKYKDAYPAYADVSVCDEWVYFSNFKSWMETQDWEGKELDKDILLIGNKIYSPDTCVFVDAKLNSFILDNSARRGNWPIGVYYDKRKNRYMSRCSIGDGYGYLGCFGTPEEAHNAWRTAKWKLAQEFIALETDHRIIEALISRFKIEDIN